jgi:bifunctional non-homologous end joining protein LigD
VLGDDTSTTDRLVVSEEIEADGDQLLANACEHGLEGIIAKDRNSAYRSGRLGDWLKIKCVQSESFFIVGYERSVAARGQIGSLLLAGRRGDELVYVGSVGTGFKESEAWRLRGMMDRIRLLALFVIVVTTCVMSPASTKAMRTKTAVAEATDAI